MTKVKEKVYIYTYLLYILYIYYIMLNDKDSK